jgi:hypothetical protein
MAHMQITRRRRRKPSAIVRQRRWRKTSHAVVKSSQTKLRGI